MRQLARNLLGTGLGAGVGKSSCALDEPFLHDLISVGRQIEKYGLGDMRALIGRDPFIVQVRPAVALGILDEGRVDRVRNQYLDRSVRHHSGFSKIEQRQQMNARPESPTA
jgi:hypothetical protein